MARPLAGRASRVRDASGVLIAGSSSPGPSRRAPAHQYAGATARAPRRRGTSRGVAHGERLHEHRPTSRRAESRRAQHLPAGPTASSRSATEIRRQGSAGRGRFRHHHRSATTRTPSSVRRPRSSASSRRRGSLSAPRPTVVDRAGRRAAAGHAGDLRQRRQQPSSTSVGRTPPRSHSSRRRRESGPRRCAHRGSPSGRSAASSKPRIGSSSSRRDEWAGMGCRRSRCSRMATPACQRDGRAALFLGDELTERSPPRPSRGRRCSVSPHRRRARSELLTCGGATSI